MQYLGPLFKPGVNGLKHLLMYRQNTKDGSSNC